MAESLREGEKNKISKPQVMGYVLKQAQPDSRSAEALSSSSEEVRRGWREQLSLVLCTERLTCVILFSSLNFPSA